MSAPSWRKAIVTDITEEAPATRRFWFRVPEVENFDFVPGQFVTLDLPIDENPHRRWRSYSIASWPDGGNQFELIIVKNEEGAGTTWLFDEVQKGTEIMFRGPLGKFTMPDPIDKDLFLICTGTGIAPFRSMAHYILRNHIPHKDIYLIFGTRKKENLLYHQELTDLSAAIGHFHYIPVLSRETKENWQGETGYVHEVYERLVAGKQEASFYLCGWKNMIQEARTRIVQLGYDKKDIHQEIYG